jgi:tRNA(fMet)-specific endonuclease VapC
MFLLDTDYIGIIQRQAEPEFNRLSVRMSRHAIADFYFSIISFHEQVLGWNAYLARAHDQQAVVRAYGRFEQILRDFASAQVLPFDDAAATVFESLRDQRIRVATMDLRIAAIALSRDKTVLTRNTSDFRKVPGLRVEDWTV